MIPLLASILICLTGAAVFAFAYVRVKVPLRRFLASATGAALFIGGCLASSRRIADLLGDNSEQIDMIEVYIDGGLFSLLATLAFVVLLRLHRKLGDTVDRRVDQWSGLHESVHFRGVHLVSRARVRDSFALGWKTSRLILILVLFYIYAPLVLSLFPATAPYGGQLFHYIWRPAAEIGLAVIRYLPKLAYLALLILVARYVLKLLRFFLNHVAKGDLVVGGFDPEWADPTYKLLRVVAIVFTLMVGFPYLPGAESEFFQGFSLFVGALVTLGSTAAVGNMVSGVILTYTRAFRVGDRVRIGEALGDVQARSLFVTRLRTIYNEEITIPNGLVLGGHVVNYSEAAKRGALVLRIEVGLGYEVHWRKIDDLLKAAALQTPGVLPDPPPFVWPKTLDNFAVVYELHVHTDRADKMGRTKAELQRSVLDALHDAGIEIMTPEIHGVRDSSQTALPIQDASGGPTSNPGVRIDIADQPRPHTERSGGDVASEGVPEPTSPQKNA